VKQGAGGLREEEGATAPAGSSPDRPSRPWRPAPATVQTGAALLFYAASSIAQFGVPVLAGISSRYVGWGADPATHMWFLAWWPHAIAHGLNPFTTHLVWAPSGYDLAGSTGIPGPSLLLAPITALAGPVVSYNVLALAAPALSAWSAYFLCRRITGRFAASVVGGYLFGFSTYELGQLTGHPNLVLVPLVPLAVLLVLRRLSGQLGAKAFVSFMALVLVGQFLISTEVFFTMTMFGGIGLILAAAFFGDHRGALVRAAGLIALAYLIAAVPLAPYLYHVARSASRSPIYSFYPSLYSTDALNFVVPTPLTLVGRHRFAEVARKFSGNISEQSGYVSVPLAASVLVFAVTRWRKAATRFLVIMLAVVLAASVGPTLRVKGSDTVAFPWRALIHLPLVKYVLPSRLMMYAFLLVAVIVALWLADPAKDQSEGPSRDAGKRLPALDPAWARWAVILVGVALLLPNLSYPAWRSSVNTPAFFADGLFRTRLPFGANVIIIPYADRGNAMLWQAQAGFAFRMAEGYVSVVPPPEFSGWPILKTLYSGELIPEADRELRAFLRDKGVVAIIVVKGRTGPWPQLFGPLDPSPEDVGGVLLYRVP